MTVDDCIDEYRKLGDEVFGRPRKIYTLKFLVGDRPRYNGELFKDTLRKVISRRREHVNAAENDIIFASPPDICRTLVSIFLSDLF